MADKDKNLWLQLFLDGDKVKELSKEDEKAIKWAFVTPLSYLNKTVYYFTSEEYMLPWLKMEKLLDIYETAEENRKDAIAFMETDEYKDNKARINKIQKIQVEGATENFSKILEASDIDPSEDGFIEKVKKGQNKLTGRFCHSSIVFAKTLFQSDGNTITKPDPQPLTITEPMIDDLRRYGKWFQHISSAHVLGKALVLYTKPGFQGFQKYLVGTGSYADLREWDDKAESLQDLQQT